MSSFPIPSGSKTSAPVGHPALQIHDSGTAVPMKSVDDNGGHKHAIQYGLCQNGDRAEDLCPPIYRTLQTTWSLTSGHSSDAKNHLSERMLELSRISRRAIAARMRYQRLRSRELDLIKSILADEQDLSQKQMQGIDVQIGSIHKTLDDAGVVIGSEARRFNHSEIEPWRESASDELVRLVSAGSVSRALGSSAASSDLEE